MEKERDSLFKFAQGVNYDMAGECACAAPWQRQSSKCRNTRDERVYRFVYFLFRINFLDSNMFCMWRVKCTFQRPFSFLFFAPYPYVFHADRGTWHMIHCSKLHTVSSARDNAIMNIHEKVLRSIVHWSIAANFNC